jgi:hypothetical protein
MFTSSIILSLAGTARVGDRSGAYRVLVGKPENKRPLGKPRRRWEHNIDEILKVIKHPGS